MSERALPEFSRIYEAYHGRVLACVISLIGRDEAEDVTQEVFARIGRSLHSLEDPAKLTSWVYAITLNMVRDTLRMRASRPDRRSGGHDASRQGGGGDARIALIADDRARSPEESAMRNEMIACYLSYVEQLPPRYYEVYALSEFEHLSTGEIAIRLALSPGAVKIRLHRARARLNEQLRRNCQCYRNERGELMAHPKNR